MKKTYVMPTVEVLALQAESLMMGGSNVVIDPDKESDADTNKKSWGRDLWGEEK